MSIDGLMPPNLVNMTAMIRDFSAYGVFAQQRFCARRQICGRECGNS